ncbi:MAG TPA: hypothetical protein DCZ43_09635 [candidate division Zixibacteria bacterium]|nr:hypothetical protein [candidate division Zixibacteria bacterium]
MTRPSRKERCFSILLIGLLLLSMIQFACDKDKPIASNQPDTTVILPLVPYNPQPASGAIDIGDNCIFSWQCSNPDSKAIRYEMYIGTDTLYRIFGPDTIAGYSPAWGIQSRTKAMLVQIYEMQLAYRNRNRSFCLNGNCDRSGYRVFYGELGIQIPATDIYTYCMVAGSNTFSCSAYGNLDNDGSIDSWKIDETGIIKHDIEDLNFAFQPGTSYSWKVNVIDSRGDTISSPVWHFTTTTGIVPPGYDFIPFSPLPEDHAEGVTCSTAFYWYCERPGGDSLLYDLYYGPGDCEPELVNRNLLSNQTYLNWGRQWKVQLILGRICEYEQWFYYHNGCYAYDGAHACYGYDGFIYAFGMRIEGDDLYNYCVTASCDSLLITATANIDTDPTIDRWTIDRAGIIRHVINDSEISFSPGQSYSWKVVAHDSHGFRYEGSVWHFTTAE